MRKPRQNPGPVLVWARILPANAALLVIGVLDLVSTLWWVGGGKAVEINPIMAAVLKLGVPTFVAVKLLTLAVYVAVIEWYRRTRDSVIARAVGRFTVAAYLGLYAVSFSLANRQFLIG